MISSVPAATLLGVDGRPVNVEVHVSSGLPGFCVVGQPDTACREARDRVRAALLSSGLPWPVKKVTVNLAPSGLRKVGAGCDLAIAIGLLVAADELAPEVVDGFGFVGELGLDGSVRSVPGLLPLVDALQTRAVVVPRDGVPEAMLVGRHVVHGVGSLREMIDALLGLGPWPAAPAPPVPPVDDRRPPDLVDVRGQPLARWALEVAAAGGHHLLLTGPPGGGKTLLSRCLPGLLPALDRGPALEATRIHSAAGLGLPFGGLVDRPPFRAPHHSASAVSLIGGGTSAMRPGEISLAHQGVLFLDELGEFDATVLDMLRQPLEEGVIRISRARFNVSFPARFLLVGAMNPCPCGQGGPPGACRCSPSARARYGRRVSGPLLDRFDLRIPVARAEVSELMGGSPGEGTAAVAARVATVRGLARGRGVATNADIPSWRLDELAPLTPVTSSILERELRVGGLSARGLHRVRRVARTLADLEGADVIGEAHVCGALQLRAAPPVLRTWAS